MKLFKIYFKMVDHSADDAGYNLPTECTIVDAESKTSAVTEFCKSMLGERFEVLETLELA